MTPYRQPRSLNQATPMCERYAVLAGQIAEIEAERADAIAAVNARADTPLADLGAERDLIAAKLEPWWAGAAAEITHGRRKSIELGGCVIGTRAGKAKLAVEDDKAAVAALQGKRWGKPFLRVTTALDKAALLKALPGLPTDRAAVVAGLGIARQEAGEAFFLERAEQGGTLGDAA